MCTFRVPTEAPAADSASRYPYADGVIVLDIVYVLAAIGLFGLIALIARGVEKL